MRIVFVQAGLGAGGAEKNIAAIARHRAAHGDDVHVLSMSLPPEGTYFTHSEQVTIHIMPDGGQGRLLQLRRLFYIRRMLRRLAPDLVISFLTKINVLVLCAVPERGFPVVASERNNPEVQRKHPLWRHLNEFALGRADKIVMLTERARSILPEKLKLRSEVIYVPCAPPANIRYRNREQAQVVAVGRLDHQKGFDLLIEAFAKVHRDNPHATLTIYGEGKERSRLAALIEELHLQDVVKLPGLTSGSGDWIEQGDIFVFSSRHEGFGNALAEATAAGMPSISFDCDFGPSEIITHGETGLLVPLGDVKKLADAILELLSDQELQRRLSQSARMRNSKLFDPELILAQWDDVIRNTKRV